ncbi:RNA polymerase sigma-70 factor, ECF subfamily [Ruminococcus sp. YE71]|uniref:RNA polymerase sigma factor n=1 Tax=unclassified Ruminococcus TaxID=2608920 RepID=UPI000886F7C3|nr:MULTISPECIES: sigma-70 family RNA polymerase sigma factor [unclassified Ruminococcus]SDA16923.1 RNA polymerase sigma-70 factor, ECF subfamily [Ruminococcus sp. YE78]SFW25812.1 RNA polymerase sigma-70 factor, ECF subfamily [Ruminococcus sp. YE71]
MNDLSTQTEKTERAIEQYSQLIYGIAVSQLKTRSEADDVYQEVFLTHFEKEMDFADSEHEKAWLIRTAVTLCRRYNFSPWRQRTVPLEEAAFVPETQEEKDVWKAVCELKSKLRLPIYLFYFEGMSAELIASSLGESPSAVRKQLQRGRELLRDRLEGDYFE